MANNEATSKLAILAFEQRKALGNLDLDKKEIVPILNLVQEMGFIESAEMKKVRDDYRFNNNKTDQEIDDLTNAYLDLMRGIPRSLAVNILLVAFYYPLSTERVTPGFLATLEDTIFMAIVEEEYDIVDQLEILPRRKTII